MKKFLMTAGIAIGMLSISTMHAVRIINGTGSEIVLIINTNLSSQAVTVTTATDNNIKAATGSTIPANAECNVAAGLNVAFRTPIAENVLRGRPKDYDLWIITTVQGVSDGKTYLQIAPDSGLK